MKKINGVLYNVEEQDIKLLNDEPAKFWKGVHSIGKCAFCENSQLKNIKIPDTVTSIGDWSFQDCKSLTELNLPDSVTSIGYGAFRGVPRVNFRNKSVCGDLLFPDLFEMVKMNQSINLKQLNSLFSLLKEQNLSSDDNTIRALIKLSGNLGMLEPNTTVVETDKDKDGNPIVSTVNNIVYTFLQGLIKNNQIDLSRLHVDLEKMRVYGYNEAFMKFVTNKSNWADIQENMSSLNEVYGWFKERTELDLTKNNNVTLPVKEKNRFDVMVYDRSADGCDRMYWRAPTMNYVFEDIKRQSSYLYFEGEDTDRDYEIAKALHSQKIFEQKHFDKAKEIDAERLQLGVKDVLVNPVKQDSIESLEQYRNEIKKLQKQSLNDSAEILHSQIEDTSSVFTYEVLSKSDPANFVMGCLTHCCATLYGVGGGAMRGMIVHPDMQPMVIRDFDNNIISFGIIYVNREEGYAVVNDFEVNEKYQNVPQEQRQAIYQKAMQGVKAFVNEYNHEHANKPIKKVTCGVTPHWAGISDFVSKNPGSEILKAPNFNEFQYVGRNSWSPEWNCSQYEILNLEDNHGL